MTYNIPQFRKNLKEAFKAAKSGQTVLITRHDETFRLVLDDDLKPKMVIDPRDLRVRMGKQVINKGASK